MAKRSIIYFKNLEPISEKFFSLNEKITLCEVKNRIWKRWRNLPWCRSH